MTSEHPIPPAHSGRDGHLTPFVLAEHAEGLLPPQQAGGVDDHLQACAACRNVSDALTAVSVRLADAPRELPVPTAVADRIATSLAGEQRAARPAARAPVVSLDSWTSRLRRRAPALLAAAAAVGVIGLAAYAVGGVLADRSGDDSLADSTAPDTADAPAEQAEEAEDSDDGAATLDQDADAGADDAPADDAGDGAGDDAGDGAGDDEARGDVAEESLEQDGALAPDDAEFTAEIQEVASGRAAGPSPATASAGCGADLADQLGREVVGAAVTDLVEPESVLIVVTTDDPDHVEGWVLPNCDAGPDDALDSREAPRR